MSANIVNYSMLLTKYPLKKGLSQNHVTSILLCHYETKWWHFQLCYPSTVIVNYVLAEFILFYFLHFKCQNLL